MKKLILLISFFLLLVVSSFAQQGVAINENGNTADGSAILDVSSSSKGMLIPRISLNSTTDVNTISNPATNLIVFNTNASITDGNGTGIYYYNGSKWVYVLSPDNGAGKAGEVLTSQGTSGSPQWQTIPSSGSALGTEMFTAYMDSAGMFVPHTNNCASGEAFVALFSGASVGFCIDKAENSAGEKYWTDAVRICLAAGKRLPEPGEWQIACDDQTNLGLTYGDWEWASNFPLPIYDGDDPNNRHVGIGAAIFGDGSNGCGDGGWGWLAGDAGRDELAFRCVH